MSDVLLSMVSSGRASPQPGQSDAGVSSSANRPANGFNQALETAHRQASQPKASETSTRQSEPVARTESSASQAGSSARTDDQPETGKAKESKDAASGGKDLPDGAQSSAGDESKQDTAVESSAAPRENAQAADGSAEQESGDEQSETDGDALTEEGEVSAESGEHSAETVLTDTATANLVNAALQQGQGQGQGQANPDAGDAVSKGPQQSATAEGGSDPTLPAQSQPGKLQAGSGQQLETDGRVTSGEEAHGSDKQVVDGKANTRATTNSSAAGQIPDAPDQHSQPLKAPQIGTEARTVKDASASQGASPTASAVSASVSSSATSVGQSTDAAQPVSDKSATSQVAGNAAAVTTDKTVAAGKPVQQASQTQDPTSSDIVTPNAIRSGQAGQVSPTGTSGEPASVAKPTAEAAAAAAAAAQGTVAGMRGQGGKKESGTSNPSPVTDAKSTGTGTGPGVVVASAAPKETSVSPEPESGVITVARENAPSNASANAANDAVKGAIVQAGDPKVSPDSAPAGQAGDSTQAERPAPLPVSLSPVAQALARMHQLSDANGVTEGINPDGMSADDAVELASQSTDTKGKPSLLEQLAFLRGLRLPPARESQALQSAESGTNTLTDPIRLSTASPVDAAMLGAGNKPAAQPQPLVTTLQASVFQAQWAPEMGQKLAMMISQQINEAEIRLDPPELGPMRVNIRMQNEQANVTFTSHSAIVRDTLEQAMPRLRDMLEQQGLGLGDANVRDQSSRQGQGQHEQGDGVAGVQADVLDDGLPDTEALVSHRGGSTRLVDFYA